MGTEDFRLSCQQNHPGDCLNMQLKKKVVAGMIPSPVVISAPLFPTNRRAVWAVGPGNLKPWTKLLTAQNGPQSQATYRRFHPQQSEDAAHNTSHTM